jgi:hypothetical protein
MTALELDEEAALAEPPEADPGFGACAPDVGEKRVVCEEGVFHNSSRTSFVPATRFTSFCFAAQRAV